jgi:hypothetical protein
MMREWRKKNPRSAKNADLKKTHGISLEQYEEMLDSQRGRCAACRDEAGERALHVDHCHGTGVIRGLLCAACNTALGLLRESPLRMQALICYIETRSAKWLL